MILNLDMILTIIILSLIYIVVVRSYYENNNYIVTSYETHFDNIDSPIKICLLSDLHGNQFKNNNEKLVEDIINLHPDIILITGDLIVEKYTESYKVAGDFIEKLSNSFYNKKTSRPRIFYSLGNHEERALLDHTKKDLINSLFDKCAANKVVVLDNKSTKIKVKNNLINIAGISLGVKAYTKFTNKYITDSLVDSCIQKSYNRSRYNTKDINIIMSHHPYSYKYLNDYYMVLSGHFHGGLVRLPILGGLITPQPLAKGIISHGMTHNNNSYHIVSSGLGWHSIPIRLFNRTEIVDITIQ